MTVVPLVTFLTTAVPAVVEVAVTVTVMVSPAEIVIPVLCQNGALRALLAR